MAINSFSHAVLSASLVSFPELALGSGVDSVGSVSDVVSLTAGENKHTPGKATGIGTRKSGLSGIIGLRQLGAIGQWLKESIVIIDCIQLTNYRERLPDIYVCKFWCI